MLTPSTLLTLIRMQASDVRWASRCDTCLRMMDDQIMAATHV